MVPQSLSTVLFAVASAAPEKFAEKLRFVLRMSLVIGIPAGLALGLCGHLILSIFGSSYAALAAGPLWLQIVGYIPALPNTLYITVARAKGQFNQASIFLTVFAAIRMAALVVGGKADGLYGLSYAVLAVLTLQALITTPSVLRTAFRNVAVQPEADSALIREARQRSIEVADDIRLQQEAGLAALFALATRVGPSPDAPDTDALATNSTTWLGLSQRKQSVPQHGMAVSRGRRGRFNPIVAVTRANQAITHTNWWPDIDEETFSSRQEMGMAALIAIATQSAKS
jgi:hypothetical protein